VAVFKQIHANEMDIVTRVVPLCQRDYATRSPAVA
jgi:hypothetical protein